MNTAHMGMFVLISSLGYFTEQDRLSCGYYQCSYLSEFSEVSVKTVCNIPGIEYPESIGGGLIKTVWLSYQYRTGKYSYSVKLTPNQAVRVRSG